MEGQEAGEGVWGEGGAGRERETAGVGDEAHPGRAPDRADHGRRGREGSGSAGPAQGIVTVCVGGGGLQPLASVVPGGSPRGCWRAARRRKLPQRGEWPRRQRRRRRRRRAAPASNGPCPETPRSHHPALRLLSPVTALPPSQCCSYQASPPDPPLHDMKKKSCGGRALRSAACSTFPIKADCEPRTGWRKNRSRTSAPRDSNTRLARGLR